MKTIEETLNDLISQFERIEELEKESNKLQSEHDLELARLYHVIEGTTITHVSQSHKIIKEMQELLIKRRNNKFENALLKSTTSLLRSQIQSLKAKLQSNANKKTAYFIEIKEFAKNN
jgi:hypothetical protein